MEILISPNHWIHLSKEAVDLINDETLSKQWNDMAEYYETTDDEMIKNCIQNSIDCDEDPYCICLTSNETFNEIKRNDPRLINTYKKLGNKILSKVYHSEGSEEPILCVIDIPDDYEYEICEYYLGGEFVRIKKDGWYKDYHYNDKDKDVL